MIFLIHAKEAIYDGLHGIESTDIVEVDTLEEAHNIAYEMSLDVINSYSDVYDELETEVEETIAYEDTVKWTDKRIDDLRGEIYNDDVCYDLYELDEEKVKDLSWETLINEAYEDIEEFLEKYRKQEF